MSQEDVDRMKEQYEEFVRREFQELQEYQTSMQHESPDPLRESISRHREDFHTAHFQDIDRLEQISRSLTSQDLERRMDEMQQAQFLLISWLAETLQRRLGLIIPHRDPGDVQRRLERLYPAPPAIPRPVQPAQRQRDVSMEQRRREIDINMFPTRIVKDDSCDQCSICLEDYEPDTTVRQLPCNHCFHTDCLIPWLKEHRTCPLCRHNFQ